MELDTHADTCAFGQNCLIVNDTGMQVSVDPFVQSLGSVPSVSVVTAAVAYDDPTTYHTYVMFFHQALHIPLMDHHLIAPFQLRENGIEVNDVLLQHTSPAKRTDSQHTICIPDKDLTLPLSLKGTMSGLDIRTPTWTEVLDEDQLFVTHLHMTSESVWNPSKPDYQHTEEALKKALEDDYVDPARHVHSTQVRGQFLDDCAADMTNKSSDCIPRAAIKSLTTHCDLDELATAVQSWAIDTDALILRTRSCNPDQSPE